MKAWGKAWALVVGRQRPAILKYGESDKSQRVAHSAAVWKPVSGGGSRPREPPVRSACSTSEFGHTQERIGGPGGGQTLTYQGRRDALEEPTGTEPLLTRDDRERMEGRMALEVRRGVLEAILHFCMG